MSASDYLEGVVLDHIFNKQVYVPPANLYVALLVQEAAENQDGTQLVEVNYTGYQRVQTQPAGWSRTNNVMGNNTKIQFGKCTAGAANATHFAILDAAGGGNVLFKNALNAPLAISAGITPEFGIDQLNVSAD